MNILDFTLFVDEPPIQQVLVEEQLPLEYLQALREHIAPTAQALAVRALDADAPLVVGINGSQGSGKSTLVRFLALFLKSVSRLRCAVLSIDDLYLGQSDRLALSNRLNPLLRTRGVPGTHDVALGMQLLDQLRQAGQNSCIALPRFDKARDDALPKSEWPIWEGGVDLILFEGWCVGCTPQTPEMLSDPINALEQDEDEDARWRRYINQRLETDYRSWFEQLDVRIMLKSPSFDSVYQWRSEQESKLAEKMATQIDGGQSNSAGIMDAVALRRFIQHYQRLTEHMLQDLPGRSDAVLHLDTEHRITHHDGPLYD